MEPFSLISKDGKVDLLKHYLTHYTDETIGIFIAVLAMFFVILVGYWFYNRRKFHQLSHQIPASVVKNYLDSIIANSTALKSSLFRGGGLELGEGVPSILPTSELPSGGVSLSSNSEEVAQKNAEIDNLRSLLAQKDGTIAELERMLEGSRSGDSTQEVGILKGEISSLKAQLEEANNALANAPTNAAAPADNKVLLGQLDEVTKERDELRERLMEYEVIEGDLADLKKYQQENEELKKTIAELQGGATPPPAEEAIAEPPASEEDLEPISPPMEEAPEEVEPEVEEPAAEDSEEVEVPANEGEQKSAQELLSEFEKMLG